MNDQSTLKIKIFTAPYKGNFDINEENCAVASNYLKENIYSLFYDTQETLNPENTYFYEKNPKEKFKNSLLEWWERKISNRSHTLCATNLLTINHLQEENRLHLDKKEELYNIIKLGTANLFEGQNENEAFFRIKNIQKSSQDIIYYQEYISNFIKKTNNMQNTFKNTLHKNTEHNSIENTNQHSISNYSPVIIVSFLFGLAIIIFYSFYRKKIHTLLLLAIMLVGVFLYSKAKYAFLEEKKSLEDLNIPTLSQKQSLFKEVEKEMKPHFEEIKEEILFLKTIGKNVMMHESFNNTIHDELMRIKDNIINQTQKLKVVSSKNTKDHPEIESISIYMKKEILDLYLQWSHLYKEAERESELSRTQKSTEVVESYMRFIKNKILTSDKDIFQRIKETSTTNQTSSEDIKNLNHELNIIIKNIQELNNDLKNEAKGIYKTEPPGDNAFFKEIISNIHKDVHEKCQTLITKNLNNTEEKEDLTYFNHCKETLHIGHEALCIADFGEKACETQK